MFSFLSLFITRRCTLRCHYCNLPDNKTYVMSGDEWITVIDKLAPHSGFFNLIGGEPTLHPDLPRIITHLNKIKANYCMVTNSTESQDYYRKLIEEAGLKSICVSIDGINSTDKKSTLGRSLAAFIDDELHFSGGRVISSAISNLKNTVEIMDFADRYGFKVALTVLQCSTDEEQMNSNNPLNTDFSKEETVKTLKFIVANYEELPLADPIEYFINSLYFLTFNREWHCAKGLTPAVDCSGELWSCFDFKGKISNYMNSGRYNLLRENFDYKVMHEVIKYECGRCPGCTWNCPYVSEIIADGLIESPFI